MSKLLLRPKPPDETGRIIELLPNPPGSLPFYHVTLFIFIDSDVDQKLPTGGENKPSSQ